MRHHESIIPTRSPRMSLVTVRASASSITCSGSDLYTHHQDQHTDTPTRYDHSQDSKHWSSAASLSAPPKCAPLERFVGIWSKGMCVCRAICSPTCRKRAMRSVSGCCRSKSTMDWSTLYVSPHWLRCRPYTHEKDRGKSAECLYIPKAALTDDMKRGTERSRCGGPLLGSILGVRRRGHRGRWATAAWPCTGSSDGPARCKSAVPPAAQGRVGGAPCMPQPHACEACERWVTS